MQRTKVVLFEGVAACHINRNIDAWLQSCPNAVITKAETIVGGNNNGTLCIVTTITYVG